MTRRRLTGPGTAVDSLETHQAHEPLDTLPVSPVALTPQPGGYLACPVKRCDQVLTVDQFHKREILLRYSSCLVVQAGAADIQQPALAYY